MLTRSLHGEAGYVHGGQSADGSMNALTSFGLGSASTAKCLRTKLRKTVREQQVPATHWRQASQELLLTLAQPMPSSTGHHPTGPCPDRQSQQLVTCSKETLWHIEGMSQVQGPARETSKRYSWKQAWRQAYIVGPRSIQESGLETSYDLGLSGPSRRAALCSYI